MRRAADQPDGEWPAESESLLRADCERDCFLSLSLSTRQVSACCCCLCCLCCRCCLCSAPLLLLVSFFVLVPLNGAALDRAACSPPTTHPHRSTTSSTKHSNDQPHHAHAHTYTRQPPSPHARTNSGPHHWEERSAAQRQSSRQPASPRRHLPPPLHLLSTPRSALLLSVPRAPPPHPIALTTPLR